MWHFTLYLYMDGSIWVFEFLGSAMRGCWEGRALDFSTKFDVSMPYCLLENSKINKWVPAQKRAWTP